MRRSLARTRPVEVLAGGARKRRMEPAPHLVAGGAVEVERRRHLAAWVERLGTARRERAAGDLGAEVGHLAFDGGEVAALALGLGGGQQTLDVRVSRRTEHLGGRAP